MPTTIRNQVTDPPPEAAGRTLDPRENIKKRLWFDRLATHGVTLGGWVIIASILAILFVIVLEFYPLFKEPTATLEQTLTTEVNGPVLATGLDEYREVAYLVTASGIYFHSLVSSKTFLPVSLPELGGAAITAVSTSQVDESLVLGLSDGRILPVRADFENRYQGDERTVEPAFAADALLSIRTDGEPVTLVTHRNTEDGLWIAGVIGPGEVEWIRIVEKRNLMGTSTKKTLRDTIAFPVKGRISALMLDGIEGSLIAGTHTGQILRAWLPNEEDGSLAPIDVVGATASLDVGVTLLESLLGDYTLIVGDSSGGVSSFHWMDRADGLRGLQKIHSFSPHSGPVEFFSKSLRTKGFLTGGGGQIQVHYGSTGESQLALKHPQGDSVQALSLSRKENGILVADTKGRLLHWNLNNPFPEITFKSVFGKVWYEGYEGPEYVWQSTGGTDAFESKFSLVPLIFGTLKGTLYALLFAVPLALLGAFYTSQFMHPRLKGVVKPAIEMMAALPSVVLGFFAALLIAPQVEKFLPGILLVPLVITGVILAALLFYEGSEMLYGKIPAGREIAFLIPLTFIGAVLSFYIGQVVEAQFLFGDHRTFWHEVFNVTYDQRNALVVGLAMGFAVIPIIFTITEDSLSNVPEHLRASSLALGATPWQTAVNVILPTASPGIFSAVMIGFGRAVGETMIVLMATGNTPVMEWSIFNGLRALSANIAVELPEAPEGGTLFRLLFLAAFLLFVMTFIVNTVAELVRLRLRKRYRVL